MQGAIRIEARSAVPEKKEFPLRRTAMIAAFFVFTALAATISNGNTDDLNSKQPDRNS